MYRRKKTMLLVGVGAMLLPQLAFGKTLGTVNADVLNVRSKPTTSSSIVTKVYAKDSVQITDLVNPTDPWYKVNVQGKEAYVKQDYLDLTRADGTVTATSLNIRSYPDLNNSKVIGSLKNGTQLEVLYKVNGFYKIMINGSAGFVSSDYIDCKYDAYVASQSLKNVGTISVWTGGTGSSSTSSGSTSNSSSSKVTGDQIVATAKKYLGNPYVYGGTSLTNGTDCSGFTQGVMKIHGINLPRTASEQSKVGTAISKSNLQKGDLVFFGTSASSISHCGIYIGDGDMIHASTPEKGIIISDINKMGNLQLQVSRRVI